MSNRLLTPPSSLLFQDAELDNVIQESKPLLMQVLNEVAELGNVIRDSKPLLLHVLNEERELVIVDNIREIRNAEVEQAFNIVVDTADISDFISIIGDEDIDRTLETSEDNDNGDSDNGDDRTPETNEDNDNGDDRTPETNDDNDNGDDRTPETNDDNDNGDDRTPETSEDNDNGDSDNGENSLSNINDDQQLFGFCMYCAKYKRAYKYDQIKRGDSIRFSRVEGLYHHHAIVKEVQIGPKSSCCILTLIHLKKIGAVLLTQVIENTNTYNLREEIVEKVIYESNPFTPDEIVRRAEKYAAENTTPVVYDLFGNNCEHLCNLFAQNVRISHQVSDKLKFGIPWIFNTLFKIGSSIMNIPEINSCLSTLSLCKIIYKMRTLKKMFQDKLVCFGCYDKEYKKLKMTLVLSVISFAASVLNHFDWPTLQIGMIISIALPFGVPLMYKYILPLIQPAFLIPKQTLSIQNIPRTGDVITFNYYNLPHEGVVSTVHEIGSDITRLKATIIHFPWPGLFNTYTVTEEAIYFNQTDDISVLDFEGMHHLPASIVVQKARGELGQQNHSHFTYRSSHLSRYCKTGNKSLETLPTVPVRSINDLSPGDVIRFRYYGLPHEAVLVSIAEAENIRINVIHYNYAGMFGSREVVNEEMTFKLSDKNVHIHDYANVEVYEPDEVVRRAESRVGEQEFNTFINRSSHLAKWCKIKQN